MPPSETTYRSEPEEVARERQARAERRDRFESLQNKEKTLLLAGTMALSMRPCSPLSKLKETRGIVTVKRVQDCFERKNALVQEEMPKSTYEFKN